MVALPMSHRVSFASGTCSHCIALFDRNLNSLGVKLCPGLSEHFPSQTIFADLTHHFDAGRRELTPFGDVGYFVQRKVVRDVEVRFGFHVMAVLDVMQQRTE